MRKVIVNSTPLIALCKIQALDILRQLYGEVTIPESVLMEILFKRDSACQQIQANANWVHIDRIRDENARAAFEPNLHVGEVDVIILARGERDALVILDDYRARQKARALGLRLTGTLGVLVRAKSAGLIPQVAPLAIALKENGIYIADNILAQTLKNSGE